MSTPEILKEIDRFREKLLQLSNSNPLLNYRTSKLKTLTIVGERPDLIFGRLVGEGKKFRFAARPDDGGAIGEETATADSDDPASAAWMSSDSLDLDPPRLPVVAGRRGDDVLQTDLSEARLDAVLKNLRREAHGAILETGVNYLYLALGMLVWREDESSERELRAPLLLIPVEVVQEYDNRSNRYQHVVVWREEEIQDNLCLVKRFENDFGVRVPRLDDEESPEAYFKRVHQAVRRQSHWRVESQALIGFFSFQKLLMYLDIDPRNWTGKGAISEGSLLHRVIWGSADGASDSLYAPDYDIDQHPAADELVFPLDADSSQHSALVDIQSGKSLVIEGPPGTGKSQTITNAIAASLHQGKTVLFVAEKLTALEVVREKLTRLGLGDFCLELHSDAASPRRVYESLRSRLEGEYRAPGALHEIQEELRRKKSQLGEYLAATAVPAGPYQEPLHSLFWRVTNLRSLGYTSLQGTDAESVTNRVTFNENAELLDSFAETLKELPAPFESRWSGCRLPRLNPNQLGWVEAAVTSMRNHAAQIDAVVAESSEALGQEVVGWISKRLNASDPYGPVDLLCIAAGVLPRSGGLLPLLDEQGRRLATELRDILVERHSAANAAAPLLATGLDEAVAPAQTLRDLMEEGGEDLFGQVSLDELASFSRLVGPLSEFVADATSDRSNPLDRAAVRRRLERDLGKDLLGSLARVHDAAETFTAQAEWLTHERSSELADWYIGHIYRKELPDKLRALASRRPCDAPVANLQLLGEPEPRALAKSLADAVRASKELLERIENRLFTRGEEFDFRAESAQKLLLEGLAPFPRGTTWDGVKVAHARLKTLIDLLGEIGRLAKEAEAQSLGPCRTFDELQRALYLGKLARHSIVPPGAQLSSRLFLKAAETSLARGRDVCRQLLEESSSLSEWFDLASLPTPPELNDLLQVFRMDGRGFFRFLKPGYRAAKRRVMAFAKGVLPAHASATISRLEKLIDWTRRREAFAADEDLKQLFADRFLGVDTDWDQCKTLYLWAVTARGKGIDHAAALTMLERRDDGRLSIRELQAAVQSLASELDDGELLRLLGFGAADGVGPIPLSVLDSRARTLHETISQAVESTNFFTVNSNDTIEQVAEFCRDVLSLSRIRADLVDANKWGPLGEWCDGLDADMLDEAASWMSDFVDLGLPLAVQRSLMDSGLHGSLNKLAEDLEKCQPAVDAWRAWQPSLKAIRDWLRVDGPSVENLVAGIGAFRLPPGASMTEAREVADLVLKADELRSLAADSERWKPLGSLYQSLETSGDQLGKAVEWAACLSELGLPARVAAKIASGDSASLTRSLRDWIHRAGSAHAGWDAERQKFQKVGTVERDWMRWRFPKPNERRLSEDADALLAEVPSLPAWLAFCRMDEGCREAGLGDFVDAVLVDQVPPDRIEGVYRFTVLESVAESYLTGSALLRRFSRVSMEKIRQRFQELDRELLAVNQALVAHHASRQTPPPGVSVGKVGEYTELGLIRHEVQKQRRHCRIRDLLTRAGSAVQALKPCFMMSPLSVSQYLAPEGITFDLVVMDEASQVKPEDAIGVLLRAKQMVVVGDPKQLPPSSYFDKIGTDVSDEEAVAFDNTESILEVAMKAFQPVRRLRWHYRSLHESLIHFSNDRFYDGDLVVFPSPSTEAGLLGIRHHFVEGAVFSKGANRLEAEAVARAIVEHAKSRPDESLAVGAFNATQSGLIQDYLESLCSADPDARAALEVLSSREKLIVKNLENLQGDERDVVFISYTYGPDPTSGIVHNRFGPITGEAGWRRLNVLVSRARKRVEVFSSFKPSDVKIDPGKSRGVQAFRDYLEYAMSGALPERAVLSARPMDSPFEEAVGRAIQQMGLEIVPQVGVAGYFIDLGVRQPGEESFLIGVECDGATYHSSKSARDRDRLREEIIRSRGWDLHRIWSTDWYLNQKHEEERLRRRLTEAVEAGGRSL